MVEKSAVGDFMPGNSPSRFATPTNRASVTTSGTNGRAIAAEHVAHHAFQVFDHELGGHGPCDSARWRSPHRASKAKAITTPDATSV